MSDAQSHIPPDEELEFLISQYLDGTLDESQQEALVERIRQNPELARVLEEYRATDRMIRQAAGEVPEIDWAEFEAGVRRGRQASRVGSGGWRKTIRIFAPLAAAAAVAIVFSLLYQARPDRGSVGAASRVVTVVEIARPAEPTPEPGDAFVSYSYEPDKSYEQEQSAERSRPIIALAAVGADVDWPADPHGSDEPITQ
jgi:hypothetical protein